MEFGYNPNFFGSMFCLIFFSFTYFYLHDIIIYDIGGYMDRDLINLYKNFKIKIDDFWRLL